MISKILAILEGIKALGKIVETLQGLYDKWQDGKIDNHYEEKRKRMDRLVRQIDVESRKENPDDNKLRDLHRKLRNLKSRN